MVSGRRAFTGDSRIETLHAILKEHPRTSPVCARRADGARPLVRRCLEKAPSSRFQTARDLVFALENLSRRPAPSVTRHSLAPALEALSPLVRRFAIARLVTIAGAALVAVDKRPRPAPAHCAVNAATSAGDPPSRHRGVALREYHAKASEGILRGRA